GACRGGARWGQAVRARRSADLSQSGVVAFFWRPWSQNGLLWIKWTVRCLMKHEEIGFEEERVIAIGRNAVEKGKSRIQRTHGNKDRKSTRLNSSHQIISYAVFC